MLYGVAQIRNREIVRNTGQPRVELISFHGEIWTGEKPRADAMVKRIMERAPSAEFVAVPIPGVE